MSYTDLIPVPAATSINGLTGPCPTNLLVTRHGMPISALPEDCEPPTSPFWRRRMVTKLVGPFRVTGLDLAVELLKESLDALTKVDPVLVAHLGSAGMLCCRCVRGHPGLLSNHGLGMAIDFTIGGHLDQRGDGKCQKGMLVIYETLKRFGWFWGAEFRTEDAMHFEVGDRKVREWINAGRL